MLLRSSFSSILPLFEGVLVGNHPVLSHLCRAFFEKRPPPFSTPLPIVERGVSVRRLRQVAAAFGLFRPSAPLRLPPRHCFVSAPVGCGVPSL